jgi:hypothetical protein
MHRDRELVLSGPADGLLDVGRPGGADHPDRRVSDGGVEAGQLPVRAGVAGSEKRALEKRLELGEVGRVGRGEMHGAPWALAGSGSGCTKDERGR